MAIKSYDLVLSVTGKNPGGASELPSTFMYSYTFTRNQMAVGSTSAAFMLMTSPRSWCLTSTRNCGEAPMSAADLVTAPPRRIYSKPIRCHACRYLRAIDFFCDHLSGTAHVMVMTSLKPLDEITGGNMFALPNRQRLPPGSGPGAKPAFGVSDTAGISGLFS